MRITQVEAIILESPKDYGVHGGEAAGPRFRSLLRVSTDAKIDGWAEIETQPHVLKAVIDAPGDGSGMFEGLGRLMIGRDPFEIETIWNELYTGTIYYGRRGVVLQAISGIDLACFDIMGKALGKPVHALLGTARRDRVTAYASTLFRSTPREMHQAVEKYLDQGFTAVKFGWGGFGKDRARDTANVAAAREALGQDHVLLIDAGWTIPRTVEETVALCRAMEPFDPFWIEEPCHPEEYASYRSVAEASPLRIAAGEQEATAWGFDLLIRQGKVDVAQPDLSRCGGFTVAKKVMAIAKEAGCEVCPHAWQSDLLTAASLHLNAVLPEALFQEYNVCDDPISRALCRSPLKLVDGTLAVPQGPGLGVEIDVETVNRYRVKG
ncbi:MAG TPA: mandelate racemase/muconate lactonizing enzyme family protein [Planctomycetota bacterium]|nr:mandelate racemase/muconate lactonizing enzyme family protein [Planctomycetota bacterium]